MKTISYLSLFIGILLSGSSCHEESLPEIETRLVSSETRAVLPVEFDWANVDWMPTPPGQTQIPSPWVGSGSIASAYDMEIVNDRHKTDGWEMVYNTFDANAPAPLINPYFVLYNKYRGTIRFYLYLTTQFIAPSSYIQDGISVNTSYSTSLLRFLGREIVDASAEDANQYDQIQPVPYDGSSPLASNKWYMLQYELAYDPNLASIPYNYIQLNWYLNYCNVQHIDLGGQQVGTIAGTLGSAGSSGLLSKFKKVAEVTGTGVLAGIGTNFIDKNTINEQTGENKLGLNKQIFKTISSGLQSVLSGSIKDLPGAVFKGLSAIFGSKDNQPIPVNLQFKSTISLTGTLSEKGSFPSSPFSFWVPGTNIETENAVGQIPLYNKSLGILNFEGRPKLPAPILTKQEIMGTGLWNIHAVYRDSDFKKYLNINPEVLKIATVTVDQEIIVLDINNAFQDYFMLTCYLGSYEKGKRIDHEYFHRNLAVRFTIHITPKNGDSPSVIIKTFKIDQERVVEYC